MATPLIKYIESPQPKLEVVLTDQFLDITVHESIRSAIEEKWRDGVVYLDIDMGTVEFMDSSGVGLLVGLHKRLGSSQKRIHLTNIRPALRNIFKLLCLEDLFEFDSSDS